MRLACFVLLGLALWACGSKSALVTSGDNEPLFDAGTDGSTDAVVDTPSDVPVDTAPDLFEDVWVFNTVRAVCDTFVVQFCGGSVASARLSYDDACAGENPSTVEPYVAEYEVREDGLIELRFTTSPMRTGPEMDPTGAVLRYVADPSGRRELDLLVLEEWLGVQGTLFAWTSGRRLETIARPPPPGFVRCE